MLGLVTQLELAQFGLILLVIGCDTHSTATFRMRFRRLEVHRQEFRVQFRGTLTGTRRNVPYVVAMFSIHRQALLAMLRYAA